MPKINWNRIDTGTVILALCQKRYRFVKRKFAGYDSKNKIVKFWLYDSSTGATDFQGFVEENLVYLETQSE